MFTMLWGFVIGAAMGPASVAGPLLALVAKSAAAAAAAVVGTPATVTPGNGTPEEFMDWICCGEGEAGVNVRGSGDAVRPVMVPEEVRHTSFADHCPEPASRSAARARNTLQVSRSSLRNCRNSLMLARNGASFKDAGTSIGSTSPTTLPWSGRRTSRQKPTALESCAKSPALVLRSASVLRSLTKW